MVLATQPNLVSRLKSTAIPPLPLWALMAGYKVNFTFSTFPNQAEDYNSDELKRNHQFESINLHDWTHTNAVYRPSSHEKK
jgi:hypothetical protein